MTAQLERVRSSGPQPRSRTEPIPLAWAATSLGILLGGYLFFDKAFAYLHIPGTIFFVGELVIALAAAYLLWSRPRAGVSSSLPGLLLIAFVIWSLFRTIPYLPQYQFDAIRDAALYYYSVLAVLGLVIVQRYGFERISHWFGRMQTPFILWAPAAIVLTNIASRPLVPDSDVPIFSHRVANISVMLSGAVLYMWLIDNPKRPLDFTRRALLTALASVMIVFSGIANRGGMVASIVGFGLAGLLSRSGKRRHFIPIMIVTLTIALGVAWVTDLRLAVFANDREVSVQQLVDNLTSVLLPGSGVGSSDLDQNANWRMEFWTAIVRDVSANHIALGLGYGENLAARYGFEGREENFRTAHNSHVSVFGRSGLVGLGIWLMMWWAWFYALLRSRRRFIARGNFLVADICAWLVVMGVIMLLNAIFDPTIETPMVGAWAWAMFGVGLGAMAASRSRPLVARIGRHSPI